MSSLAKKVANLSKDAIDMRRCLSEGVAALAAFEKYCHDYKGHAISPRLAAWRIHAVALVASPSEE